MDKTQTSEVELTNEKTNLRQAETAAGQFPRDVPPVAGWGDDLYRSG